MWLELLLTLFFSFFELRAFQNKFGAKTIRNIFDEIIRVIFFVDVYLEIFII